LKIPLDTIAKIVYDTHKMKIKSTYSHPLPDRECPVNQDLYGSVEVAQTRTISHFADQVNTFSVSWLISRDNQ